MNFPTDLHSKNKTSPNSSRGEGLISFESIASEGQKRKLAVAMRAVEGNAIVQYMSQHFFQCELVRYLERKDLLALRRVCRGIRQSLFENGAVKLALKVDVEKLNSFQQFPGLYPTLQDLGESENYVRKLLPIKAAVKNGKELQNMLQDERIEIKSVVFEGELEALDSLLKEVPVNTIKVLEIMKNIPEGTILDLRICTNLVSVKMGYIHDTLKLPASGKLTTFESGNIGSIFNSSVTVDLTGYPQLTNVKVGGISDTCTLKLPTSDKLTSFESGDIDWNSTVDLSRCPQLTNVKVGSIQGTIKLSTSDKLTSFESGDIDSGVTVDLNHCPQLTSVKVGGISGTLKLPASDKLTDFEVSWGHIYSGITVDLSGYPQLTSVKVGMIAGTLKLPASKLTSFESEYIVSGATVDLSGCPQLTSVKVGTIAGTLILSKTYHASLASALPATETENIQWV